MKPFISHSGKMLPFDRANVDTDAILPKQYLKSISKFGYGDWLFDDLRYLDSGDVRTDPASRRLNPDFILNQPQYKGASVLVARENFGCGSSREHAVWALRDYGIQVVLAPSFADIFYNNCFKNGILPLALPNEIIDKLFSQVDIYPDYKLHVDLESLTLHDEYDLQCNFELDDARRQNLLLGRDDISVTLMQRDKITGFEADLQQQEPWLFTLT
ncbi:3-isopropylmalate dehydratase small subunit [Alteromonas sp. C1M14]|uniref:3-isopropylmalate dehydratase small subunit n=1 Tax=Alteromonas sp. C1M14 TaxID=2841567 RepID=UPI001C098D25|nr:3-isopropylmalate dehydratase small subunit [Alteromonas sp. C1M14]MBU2980055.1 3-isopropylmalate dehydratase small subunit [Alteromonas sp. C1M14]